MPTYDDWLAAKRAEAIDALPIPSGYRGLTLADVRRHDGNADALRAVEAWLAKAPKGYLSRRHKLAGKGLCLFGPPGVGKTLLASILAQELIRKAKEAALGKIHFSTMEGFNRARLRKMELGRILDQDETGDFIAEWIDHDRRIQRCYDARVLVLDDVGQENMSVHLGRTLNELLRERFTHGNPTIITSNFDPYDWERKFKNPSLASFVHQACLPVKLDGDDARVA